MQHAQAPAPASVLGAGSVPPPGGTAPAGTGGSPRLGFVIDNRRCIGCHACTVACSVENSVPLGYFRTWVKEVEVGVFPDTRRAFQVNRCNHCERAPCISACPTGALDRRPDGIVDLRPERCTGCQACMQACPYDALYLDPVSQTAAKCHFCAHRIDVGLLPACVVACPTGAIIAGDLNDPASEAARLLAQPGLDPVVRKPEQRTRPQVFYIGADPAALEPTLARPEPAFAWSEREVPREEFDPLLGLAAAAAPPPRLVYDVPHRRPWGPAVAAGLWARSLAAGLLLVAALFLSVGGVDPALDGPGERLLFGSVGPLLVALLALGAGVLFLGSHRRRGVLGLRALRVLITPNPRSWAPWAGYALLALVAVALIWADAGLVGGPLPAALAVVGIVVPLLATATGAFVLGQLEGRDLWQNALGLWHALAQTLVAGAAGLLLLAAIVGVELDLAIRLSAVLAFALVAHALIAFGALALPQADRNGAEAAQTLVGGLYRNRFWGLAGALGALLPALLLVAALALPPTPVTLLLPVVAGVLALVGLWVFADIWVRAGQLVPLS